MAKKTQITKKQIRATKDSSPQASNPNTASAYSMITEMIGAGAAKAQIAKAVGVSDMTIFVISKKPKANFGKIAELQSVYAQWKAGSIDLAPQRRTKASPSAVVAAPKKRGRKPKAIEAVVVTEPKKRGRKPQADKAIKPTKSVVQIAGISKIESQTEFVLREVTNEMVAGVEKQIKMLQHKLDYFRALIAVKEKYGM